MADPLTHYEHGNKTIDELMLDWSARDTALASLDITTLLSWRIGGWQRKVDNLLALLLYADWFTRSGGRTGRKKRTPMDVQRLVGMWAEALVAMTTGHDHATFTTAEHGTDELLRPLLTCPIAQLREFASALAAALEADARVPFLVWSSVRTVVEPLILARPEGAILALKKELATEIAEKVETGLDRKDIVMAIAGALAWRGEEQLQAVKRAVEAGGSPRIKGRQSCLFLGVYDAAGEQLAQVIL